MTSEQREAKLAVVRARWGLRLIRSGRGMHTNHTWLCECIDPAGRHIGFGPPYRCRDCPCGEYREMICAHCGKRPEEVKAPPVRRGGRRGALREAYQPLLTDEERQQLASLLDSHL